MLGERGAHALARQDFSRAIAPFTVAGVLPVRSGQQASRGPTASLQAGLLALRRVRPRIAHHLEDGLDHGLGPVVLNEVTAPVHDL
jgi:hypothetical protein